MVDTVTIKTETPNPSLEEQAKALNIDTSKIDTTATSQSAEPSLILGKFHTQEDLIKSYQELEKKLGSKDKAPLEESPQEDESDDNPFLPKDDQKANKEADEKSDLDKAKEEVEKANIDFDSLSNKFWENGALDEEDYSTLEQGGFPKDMVDQFIEGQKAVVELQRMKVIASVGGEDEYAAMTEWAKVNLTPKEIEAYNDAVNDDDIDRVIYAAKALRARYQTDNGVEPKGVISGSTRSTGDVYESIAQMKADMANPLYQKDPAFRLRVEQKLMRSNIL